MYDLTTQKLQTVYNELAQLPEGVIESYLTQHPQMNRLSKKSINTMRVVTIRTNDPSHGLEQDRVYFVYAFVRMGRGDSFLDNMHSGGLGAFLELNSGTVITEGISMALEAYEHHPDTGERIPGFQIPMYKEAMEMVTRAASRVYVYLGWDVAFTPNGPVLIECNSQPGTEPVQGPFHLRSIGMKGAIDRYL